MLRTAIAAIVLIAIACSARSQTATNAPPVGEYSLKAVFLYNFARFVDWPEGALGEPGKPIVIGIYDPEPFGDAFKNLQGKMAKDRPLALRYGQTASDLDGCHIVFINASDDLLAKELLRHFREKPVLTVGERKGFARWGGIINFELRDDHVRLRINRKAAERAGLRLSAQLLEVAHLVDEEKP